MNYVLLGIYAQHADMEVVSGGARGADSLAALWARKNGVPFREFPADWDRFGKSAGFRRNREMLDDGPDLVVAFSEDLAASKGTSMMVGLARDAGVPVIVVS